MNAWFSPFIVPVAGCLVGAVAIVAGIWSQAQSREIRSQERLALLARGLPIQEIEQILETSRPIGPPRNPRQSLINARRASVALISSGIGLILFFVTLALILHNADVYSGAAIGLIPIAIGLGFVVDYRLQKVEVERFGQLVDDL